MTGARFRACFIKSSRGKRTLDAMHSPTMPLILEDLPVVRKLMRIAVVTETWPPEVNGVATTIARFVEGLRERHHEIQLIRPRQAQAADALPPDQVLMAGLSIPRYPNLKVGLPAKRPLSRLWSTKRPDLVHIVTEGPLGWSALQAALKLKIPVSSDFRTNFHAYSKHYRIGWLQRPIAAYLRKFHNRTHLTMVPTEAIRRELAARGFANLKVVGRGVDTVRFDPAKRDQALRSSWGASPQTPVILHVGRLAPEKNLPVLVAAYQRMKRVAPRAKLVLVGEGPACAALRAECPDAVFAGARGGEDLATYYASGDLFLFPSLTETYGNVTLEAMASGLAVVAYRYAAAAEVIEHGRSGMLADYDDAEQLIARAVHLIGAPSLWRPLGAAARSRAEALGWHQVVGSLEAAMLSVVAAGNRAAHGQPVEPSAVRRGMSL